MEDSPQSSTMISPPQSPGSAPACNPPSLFNKGHTPLQPGQATPVPPPVIAPGFESLMAAGLHLYPNQKNPLQISTLVKFWLGGPDPLDYITMYLHPENDGDNGHWHYVSCGLSDLHGDGRVHPPALNPEYPSGYGFELTFRLAREPGQNVPPVWPAKTLQKIAKYIFKTENKLLPGDHFTWSEALGEEPCSRIKHFLVAEDPELMTFSTILGRVQFLLLIGITEEELKAVQRWNGPGVLNLLRNCRETGGSLLVTDVRRRGSLFEIYPESQGLVEAGIASEGSNLCGMAACISWTETDLTQSRERELKGESALTNWDSLAEQCDKLIKSATNPVSYPRGMALACNIETAKYLPLCIQGRLKHGKHFTLKSILTETAVTFVVSRVAGTLVSTEKPFAAQGDWLQILITDSFMDEFYRSIMKVESIQQLPYTFSWPQQRLSLTVTDSLQ